MLAVCERHDLAALCRSPLAMGLLGGRYNATSRLPDDDVRGQAPACLRWFTDGQPTPEFLTRTDAVRQVLTTGGRSPAQGALAWIWAHPPRAIPLPGFRNTTQVEDNVGALRATPMTQAEHDLIENTLGRDPVGTAPRPVTAGNLAVFAETFSDLTEPDVMKGTWD